MSRPEQIRALFLAYQDRTARWSWAPEAQRNDLEIDLGLLIRRRGYEAVERDLIAWAERVAVGDARPHLWGFLKDQERAKVMQPQAASVARDVCLSCGHESFALTPAGHCMRCARAAREA